MIAVIFELWPDVDQQATYFDLAAQLRPELEGIDGFISIERFESLASKGKYLSLSFWRASLAQPRFAPRCPVARQNWCAG
jgi:heme-degrading monooxygenase HmoA